MHYDITEIEQNLTAEVQELIAPYIEIAAQRIAYRDRLEVTRWYRDQARQVLIESAANAFALSLEEMPA